MNVKMSHHYLCTLFCVSFIWSFLQFLSKSHPLLFLFLYYLYFSTFLFHIVSTKYYTILIDQLWHHMFGIRDIISKKKLNYLNTSTTSNTWQFVKSCLLRRMKILLRILIYHLKIIWSGSTVDSHWRSPTQSERAEDRKNSFLKTFLDLVNFMEFRCVFWLNLQLKNLDELHCGSQI